MASRAERWQFIPGYEGRYEVSDHGRVRSWARYGSLPTPHLRVQTTTPSGHKALTFVKHGRQRTESIHRLVLLAFVGECPVGLEVRHLDGDPANNHLSNLRYGTPSENVLDRVRHGTHHHTAKTHCRHGHPYDAVNTYITPKGKRDCRICKRAAARRRDAKRRAARVG